MNREEIKNIILRRAYECHFGDAGENYFSLPKLAEKHGIDQDTIWKICDELKEEDLIESRLSEGMVEPTSRGLLKAEELKLVDDVQIEKQNKIRMKLLSALADIKERSAIGTMIDWTTWISEAGVSESEFQSNDKLLRDQRLVKRITIRASEITPEGKEIVADYRKRKRRAEDFERLEKLEGVTVQQRGHRLEDLLGESAEWEDWEATVRPRAQGTENDIIIHTGLHYFLCSCKWEANPIEAEDAELLETRVRRRPPANGGILFSMSGFTPNCIVEMRMMIASALIIPFGPADIRLIMHNEAKMKDLLFEKIDQVMTHRKYLIDGETL